jgi:hypothetical protein
MVVTQGTGGGFGSCSGFTPLATGSSVYSGTLAAFPVGGYATGLSNWATSGTATESRTYQFTWTIDPNAGNTTQNGTASIGLTWQAQS